MKSPKMNSLSVIIAKNKKNKAAKKCFNLIEYILALKKFVNFKEFLVLSEYNI